MITKKQVFFFLGSIILIYFVLFNEYEHQNYSNNIIFVNILKSILLSFFVSLILHLYQKKK
jgi:hypothetical protein